MPTDVTNVLFPFISNESLLQQLSSFSKKKVSENDGKANAEHKK
jgi:hypothetical protein